MRLDEIARTFIGVPWRESGRTRAGVDCVGLIAACAQEAGFALDPSFDYTRKTPPAQLSRAMYRAGRRVALTDMQVGDIMVGEQGITLHIGIVSSVEPCRVIHAPLGAAVLERDLNLGIFKVRGLYRLCPKP